MTDAPPWPCVVCQDQDTRRDRHGTQVCDRCKSRIRADLRDIVDLYALVSREVAKGAGGDGRATETDIGVRVSALDFSAGLDILPQLEEWERAWRSAFGHAPYGIASEQHTALRGASIGPTLTWVVAYLLAQLDQACAWYEPEPRTSAGPSGVPWSLEADGTRWANGEYPGIAAFAHEVRDLKRRAQSATRTLPRSKWSVTCPTDVDVDDLCGNRLTGAGIQFDDHVYCRACGTDWRVSRLLAVVASSKTSQTWLSADDVQFMIGIAPRTLRRWGKDGKVTRTGGMYELRSVQDAFRDTLTQSG